MNRLHVLALLVLPGALVCVERADAQYGKYSRPNYGPGYRGNISPYLNILRGQNTGIDYYLGTRSETQRRSNANEFRGDIGDLSLRETELRDRVLEPRITSGQTTTKTNDLRYYYNNTRSYFGK